MKTIGYMLVGLTLIVCAALSGCASILDGTTQEVSFQSNPEAVTVTLVRDVPIPEQQYWSGKDKYGNPLPVPIRQDLRLLGTTPFTLQLDRAEGQSVVFSKEGYKSLTMKLTTGTNPAFWGNIAIGGPFGSTTDSASGAMYEYVPSQYFVTLIPISATSMEHSTGQPQRDKALAFIVRRYASIMANLSQGGGEDWAALLALLQIRPEHEADAREKIRALALVYPDIGAFATHVTDLYLK